MVPEMAALPSNFSSTFMGCRLVSLGPIDPVHIPEIGSAAVSPDCATSETAEQST
jgi:hypothetical protein